jgi:hypothetical protein
MATLFLCPTTYSPRVSLFDRTIRIVLTDVGPNAAGECMLPEGMVGQHPRENVVCLDTLRVGTLTTLERLQAQVVATTRFDRTPLADDILHLCNAGLFTEWFAEIQPYSKGHMRPCRENPIGGTVYLEWDLLRIAIAPTISSPQLMSDALKQGAIQDPGIRRWLSELALGGLSA